MRTAGEYIHHSPFYEKSYAFHAPCLKHPKQVYISYYNEELNREIWDTMGESGGGCGDGSQSLVYGPDNWVVPCVCFLLVAGLTT